MTKVINLNSATGSVLIDDDSEPTLLLENTSSGNVLKLQNAGGTGNQLSAVSCPTTALYVVGAGYLAADFRSAASASNVVEVKKDVLSSATVAALKVSTSGASAPALEFAGTCITSTASASATVSAKIRVKYGDTYGWIPVYPTMA